MIIKLVAGADKSTCTFRFPQAERKTTATLSSLPLSCHRCRFFSFSRVELYQPPRHSWGRFFWQLYFALIGPWHASHTGERKWRWSKILAGNSLDKLIIESKEEFHKNSVFHFFFVFAAVSARNFIHCKRREEAVKMDLYVFLNRDHKGNTKCARSNLKAIITCFHLANQLMCEKNSQQFAFGRQTAAVGHLSSSWSSNGQLSGTSGDWID